MYPTLNNIMKLPPPGTNALEKSRAKSKSRDKSSALLLRSVNM